MRRCVGKHYCGPFAPGDRTHWAERVHVKQATPYLRTPRNPTCVTENPKASAKNNGMKLLIHPIDAYCTKYIKPGVSSSRMDVEQHV